MGSFFTSQNDCDFIITIMIIMIIVIIIIIIVPVVRKEFGYAVSVCFWLR